MPTYDYQCQGCGEVKELFMPIKEATTKIISINGCENCGCNDFTKTYSKPPGIAFVGSGFYTTDYKGK